MDILAKKSNFVKMTFMTTSTTNISIAPDNLSDTDISLEDFLRLYPESESGYKFEWNNGKIEQTKAMDQTQSILLSTILSRLFITTELFKKGGEFVSETHMKTSERQLRKPDLAIYLAEQKVKIAEGKNVVAPWVGEVISESDNINKVLAKLHEYFKAGVKVVWHIFPTLEEVHVYTSPDDITICRGKKVCSGQPVLADFEIAAADIFVYKTAYQK